MQITRYPLNATDLQHVEGYNNDQQRPNDTLTTPFDGVKRDFFSQRNTGLIRQAMLDKGADVSPGDTQALMTAVYFMNSSQMRSRHFADTGATFQSGGAGSSVWGRGAMIGSSDAVTVEAMN